MVNPIPKRDSHSRERSAKIRATDANTAWRQGEEGTGQAIHRTQPPPPAKWIPFRLLHAGTLGHTWEKVS